MTKLERQYRRLMRAYPSRHRASNEDEILTTLLDTAADGQQYPRPSEAAAILRAGVQCRIEQSRSVKPGLRLAGVGALAFSFAIATTAIVLAVQSPSDLGLVPSLAWLGVLAASVFAGWSDSVYRVIPPWIFALTAIFSGSAVMGLRRSVLIPAAIFLLLSIFSRRSNHLLRLGAAAVGIGAGALQGVLTAAAVNEATLSSDSPWVYDARWDLTSDAVTFESPTVLALFMVLAAAIGLWRPSFAVAGAVLATPIAMIALFESRMFAPLGVFASALALGVSLGFCWLNGRRNDRVKVHV